MLGHKYSATPPRFMVGEMQITLALFLGIREPALERLPNKPSLLLIQLVLGYFIRISTA